MVDFDKRKICPINPHGDGYCKYEQCMLFSADSHMEDGGSCAFSYLEDISLAMNDLSANGIVVFNND